MVPSLIWAFSFVSSLSQRLLSNFFGFFSYFYVQIYDVRAPVSNV